MRHLFLWAALWAGLQHPDPVHIHPETALPDHVVLIGTFPNGNSLGMAVSDSSVTLYDVIDTVYAKTLVGAVDGVNQTFTTRYASRASNVQVWLNGLLMTEGTKADYLTDGQKIVFNYPPPVSTSSAATFLTVRYEVTQLK